MSAELLRKAAAQARSEAELCRITVPTLERMYGEADAARRDARLHDAVADWLDAEAEVTELMEAQESDYQMRPKDPALAVARAYLGRES